ncbi:hypothetical protein C6A86_005965 [Mycobacterium sp. ITM-2016-00316]|uniref:hypothetical protein n=1 Tax=Mycobacterium sp. ITM-2016-00316 TaxID=2099695 RepID=UPI000CF989BD|nr:hypothetical protein [Mycobacterium sp. ITM-2016-00316]WNG83215.1 hypothetical protein C6A86_005965 [Mycobacterium sp. ITM-2016-00316]
MSSSGTYSTFIGRVGMLAVALGVGSAIAAPQVAWADQGVSSDATSASPHSTTGPPDTDSAADTADHHPKPEPALDDGGRPADDAESLTAAPDELADEDTPEPTPTGLRKVDLGSPTARSARTANGIALTITRAGRPESREAADKPVVAQRPIVITPAAEPTAVQTSAVSVTPTQGPAASGIRGVVLNVLAAIGFSPEPGRTDNRVLSEAVWGAYRRVESASAGTAPGDSAAPAAAASATMAATALPSVTAAITNRSPAATRPSSLIRTVVLGVLGIFGFNPNRTNNPVLQGIWNTYRRAESYISNIPPDITAVHVLGTSIADDGRVAVRLGFDVSDYDGDPFTVFESGIPDFEQNPDGTFTYFADAGFSGTGRAWVTAVDSGDHFHNFALWDYSGGHYRTAAITLTFAAAQPAVV